jgi:hypothetical protein
MRRVGGSPARHPAARTSGTGVRGPLAAPDGCMDVCIEEDGESLSPGDLHRRSQKR